MIDHFAPWHTHPYCVVDFETTGPDPETCHPVQVAAVRFEGGEVVDSYATLINPGVPIPEGATAVHGITDEMVATNGASPSGAIRMMFRSQIIRGGEMLVAYNEAFDRRILEREAGRCVERAGPWIDPLVISRKVNRYAQGGHELTKACERYGIELTDAHDALADATATGRLLWAMREDTGDITYSELIRRQRVYRAEQEADFQAWLAKQPAREEGQGQI